MADQSDAMLLAATGTNPWMAGMSSLGKFAQGAPSSASATSGIGSDNFSSGEVSMGNGGVRIGSGVDLNSPFTWGFGLLAAVVVLKLLKKK